MKISKRILFYRITDDSILMINSLTGAMDIVNKQIYDLLTSHESSGHTRIDDDTIEALKKRGYLIENNDEEEGRLRRLADAYAESKKRQGFVICPTYSCNLRCTYCFEDKLTHGNNLFMGDGDIERVFAAIDELRQVYSNRNNSVELFGGEPLLPRTKDFVGKVLKEAKRRSLSVRIVTNGVHLNQFTNELSAYRELIGSVQITLDGPKDIHDKRRKSASDRGTFDKVCSSIDTLLKLQIHVTARVNVDLQNISSVPALFNHMVSSGWIDNPYFSCNLSPVQDHTLKKNYEYLLTEDRLVEEVFEAIKSSPRSENTFQLNMFRNLKHIKAVLSGKKSVQPLLHYCEANNLENMIFGPDGYIYACTESMGNKEFAIGEFRPILKMYEKAIESWSNRNVLTIEKCRECDIALLCGGGCAYSAIMVNGDINEPVCNRARETIFAYLNYVKDDLLKKASA